VNFLTGTAALLDFFGLVIFTQNIFCLTNVNYFVDLFSGMDKHGYYMLNIKKQKPTRKYLFIGFRPNGQTDQRLRAVASKSQRSLSRVIGDMISTSLPTAEKRLGL